MKIFRSVKNEILGVEILKTFFFLTVSNSTYTWAFFMQFFETSFKPQFAISTLNADWSYQDDVLEHLQGRMF